MSLPPRWLICETRLWYLDMQGIRGSHLTPKAFSPLHGLWRMLSECQTSPSFSLIPESCGGIS